MNKHLDEAELMALFTLEGERQALRVNRVPANDRLLITVTPAEGFVTGPDRHQVTVDYWGTGAFLADFDDEWTYVTFAYEREDQAEVPGQLLAVASAYLRGDGIECHTRRLWRRLRRGLTLTVDGEELMLQSAK